MGLERTEEVSGKDIPRGVGSGGERRHGGGGGGRGGEASSCPWS